MSALKARGDMEMPTPVIRGEFVMIASALMVFLQRIMRPSLSLLLGLNNNSLISKASELDIVGWLVISLIEQLWINFCRFSASDRGLCIKLYLFVSPCLQRAKHSSLMVYFFLLILVCLGSVEVNSISVSPELTLGLWLKRRTVDTYCKTYQVGTTNSTTLEGSKTSETNLVLF